MLYLLSLFRMSAIDTTLAWSGKLVIWPAYFTHTHRANPDLKEDKYIITGWLETDYERKR